MRVLIRTSLGAALLWLASALPASAHVGGGALIIVPHDHIDPGQPFDVIAADMGSNTTVEFRITREHLVVPLDSARAGPDGHFQATLTLPAGFPTGYSELTAHADDGSTASTWVLVGPRTSATPPPPQQAAAAGWWSDPGAIVIGLALLGGVVVIGYLLVRDRARRRPAPVAARASSQARPRKRRRSAEPLDSPRD